MDFLLNNLELTEAVLALVGAALTWLATKGALYLGKKTKVEWDDALYLRFKEACVTAVRHTYQVYTSAIKEARRDGKLTVDEKNYALSLAKAEVRKYVGAKGLKELLKVFGLDDAALDAFLGSHVEAAVNAVKKADGNREVKSVVPFPQLPTD
jgi:hypothetical protein